MVPPPRSGQSKTSHSWKPKRLCSKSIVSRASAGVIRSRRLPQNVRSAAARSPSSSARRANRIRLERALSRSPAVHAPGAGASFPRQHRLYFLPLPHGHGSFRPMALMRGAVYLAASCEAILWWRRHAVNAPKTEQGGEPAGLGPRGERGTTASGSAGPRSSLRLRTIVRASQKGADSVVRLAGVEPATLGLEVLGAVSQRLPPFQVLQLR